MIQVKFISIRQEAASEPNNVVGNTNLILDYRPDPLFPMAQGKLPWQPILGSKWAKAADSFSLVALAFQNGLEYRHSDL